MYLYVGGPAKIKNFVLLWAVSINMQHLANLEIAENEEIEAIM